VIILMVRGDDGEDESERKGSEEERREDHIVVDVRMSDSVTATMHCHKAPSPEAT